MKPLEGIDRKANERTHFRMQAVRKPCAVAMLLALISALLGLSGSGPLSTVRVKSGDGSLDVTYDRFVRLNAPVVLDVRLAGSDDTVEIRIDADYLHEFEVEATTPPPEGARAVGQSIAYVFRTDGGSLHVRFNLRPQHLRPISGRMQSSRGESVPIGHVVFP